jgi:hypothetical protein
MEPRERTTNYGLGKWYDGDNPGAKELNKNWDIIDTELSKKVDKNSQGEQVIEGKIKFTGEVVVNNPTKEDNPATKFYVDNLIQGLDWQESVKDIVENLPSNPSEGDRYIYKGEDANKNKIAEYRNGSWEYIAVDSGTAVYVENQAKQYVFNGTNWVTLASQTQHNSLSGLQGGNETERYHLTNNQHSKLISLADDTNAQNIIDQIKKIGSLQISHEDWERVSQNNQRVRTDDDVQFNSVKSNSDIEVLDPNKGIILHSQNKRFRIRVLDNGTLVTEEVT